MDSNKQFLEPKEILEEKEFEARLDKLIKKYEHQESKLYLDSRGIPTIGSGYNLIMNDFRKDCNSSDINITEEKFTNFDEVLKNIQKEPNIKKKRDLVNTYNNGESNATITLSEADINSLYKTSVRDREKEVKRKLGDELYKKLENSNEMIAIVSMVYNGGSKMIGPNLKKALEESDRLGAWYEIRYRSNEGRMKGIQDRRNDESNAFGLYQDAENISTEEAIRVIKFMESKKNDIDNYLKEIKNDKVYIKEQEKHLAEQIKPTKNFLAIKYLNDELKFDEKDKDLEKIIQDYIDEQKTKAEEMKLSSLEYQRLAQVLINADDKYSQYKNSFNPFVPPSDEIVREEVERLKSIGDEAYIGEEAKEMALRMSGEDLNLTAIMKLEPTLYNPRVDTFATLAAFEPLLVQEEIKADDKIQETQIRQERINTFDNNSSANTYDKEVQRQQQIKEQEKQTEQIKKDQAEFEAQKAETKEKLWNAVKTVASVATFIPPLTAIGLPFKGAMLAGKAFALIKGVDLAATAVELASVAKEAVEVSKEAISWANNRTGNMDQTQDISQKVDMAEKESESVGYKLS